MKRLCTLIVFVGLGTTTGAGDDKKFESKEGRFAVAFPGTPKSITKKAVSGDLKLTVVTHAGGSLVVTYSDAVPEKIKGMKPKERLDASEKGLAENFKAKITGSKDIEFGKDKHPGRELVAERDNLHIRMTIVLVENRLYQVFVAGPKELVSGKDADAFLKSFEITN